MNKLPDVFIQHAANILADTTNGLNRSEIIKQCNKYAITYGVDIPIATTDWEDFGKKVKNKRTALYQNLSAFSGEQQFSIIKELSELPLFSCNEDALALHKLLLEKYSSYANIIGDKNLDKYNNVDKERPSVFISYSWDDEEHKKWVKCLADKLIADGIEVFLDQYDLSLGDRLPHFMEQCITKVDYVLIICTPKYKEKADKRTGGVGYEGNIISDELYKNQNERKFIPILRKGDFNTAMPKFCSGKLGIDLSETPFSNDQYNDLLTTIFGMKKKPDIGKKPDFLKKTPTTGNFLKENQNKPIHILGIITNEVSIPKMDGSRGSALYSIPFQLSATPSKLWSQLFIALWNNPPVFSTMHRPGIASVVGSKIILNGTTIDEVKKYHRDTLVLCVNEANKKEQERNIRELQLKEKETKRKQQHYQHVTDLVDEIKF